MTELQVFMEFMQFTFHLRHTFLHFLSLIQESRIIWIVYICSEVTTCLSQSLSARKNTTYPVKLDLALSPAFCRMPKMALHTDPILNPSFKPTSNQLKIPFLMSFAVSRQSPVITKNALYQQVFSLIYLYFTRMLSLNVFCTHLCTEIAMGLEGHNFSVRSSNNLFKC